MYHTYSPRSLNFNPKRRSGRSWKLMLLLLIVGFVAGIIVDQYVQNRKPIELVVNNASSDIPSVNTDNQPRQGVWSESENISVNIPAPNSVVSSPLIVEGMERTFEQNVVLRLKDKDGNELVKTNVTGNAPDMGIHGPYHAELVFEKPKTAVGTLEVFQASAKDGSEIDKVAIPVKFE